MTGAAWLRASWLALVLGGVVLVALLGRATQATQGARAIALAGGARSLADAGGYLVPLLPYQRIAAGSTVADDLLLALAEPERIAVLTRFGRQRHADVHLYGRRPAFRGATDLEFLKRQGVDLLVLNHLGSPAELARAREAGFAVFNLGEMRGLTTLLPDIAAVAALLGDPARGARLAARLVRRMRAVAADIPAQARKRALYVSAHGGQLFGGGKRTSYHDVLSAAGLIDVAAERDDFPHYDPEQLLSLDPEVLVTQHASATQLCRVSGLSNLRACRDAARAVIGMDDALLGDPGLGMLDAAEELRERVYGRRPDR